MAKKDNEIVEYEEIRARNPVTGEVEIVKIEKIDVITPEERVERVKAELNKYGLEPEYTFEITDPLTQEKRLVTNDRMGYTEEKLARALLSPEIPRDRKDFMLSMYMFERGAHNTSMIVDLLRYKGEHTKETRVFKSQLRYDFQLFVNQFTGYLKNQSRLLGIALGVNLDEEAREFREWLKLPNNEGKGYTYVDFRPEMERTTAALVELAIYANDESELLAREVQRMAEARERDKGKGIYLDNMGRPYTLDDPQMDEAIKADREATAKIEKENES